MTSGRPGSGQVGYLEKCEGCDSVRINASFGPYGFRVECLVCGFKKELDDLLEPVQQPAHAYAVAAG